MKKKLTNKTCEFIKIIYKVLWKCHVINQPTCHKMLLVIKIILEAIHRKMWNMKTNQKTIIENGDDNIYENEKQIINSEDN